MKAPGLDKLLAKLAGSFGSRLTDDPQALETVSGDESGLADGHPGAVVWPQSTAEVSLICAAAQDFGVPMVPRGAGTGKAGGCIPLGGELVVDVSRMNKLLRLEKADTYAVVQPGLINAEFDKALNEHGLMYPPDPASWESCSLGGNISTNAGGPRAAKYGVTQAYVWGLEIVVPGGEIMRTGRRSIKGVAGLDLTSLLVGSEGTLGFVTEATLHIVPLATVVETAWLSFASPVAASLGAEKIFAAGVVPRMLEMLDAQAIAAVASKSPFRIPEANAAILLECDGHDESVMAELVRACEAATAAGAIGSVIAQNQRDREGMRRARRLVSGCLKEKFPYKISDDIAVPKSRMPELLARSQEEAAPSNIPVGAYGHMGDGNLHINLLCRTPEQQLQGELIRERILKHAVAMGGTITGEHGIGIAKRNQLLFEQTPNVIALQRRIKSAFDPQGLMNPGKGFPQQ